MDIIRDYSRNKKCLTTGYKPVVWWKLHLVYLAVRLKFNEA